MIYDGMICDGMIIMRSIYKGFVETRFESEKVSGEVLCYKAYM